MKAGLYFLNQRSRYAEAAALGLVASGLSSEAELYRRNPGPWTPDQTEDFEIVCSAGMGGLMYHLVSEYNRRGVPVLLYDYGMAGRPEHHQFGLNRLNWLPPEDCPDDRLPRFKNLAINFLDQLGKYVLFLGQIGDNGDHGLTRQKAVSWFTSEARRYKKAGIPTLWRPHPHNRFAIKEVQMTAGKSIDEDLRHAGAVVTWNSSAAIQALRYGIPVYCHPSACYSELRHGDHDDLFRDGLPVDKRLEPETIRQFFCRVSYANWGLDEVEKGLAFERPIKTWREYINSNPPECPEAPGGQIWRL